MTEPRTTPAADGDRTPGGVADGDRTRGDGYGTPPVRKGRALWIFVSTAALALLTDLVTKHLALARLDGGEPVELLGGTVYLTLTRNSGAAFSLGSDYTFVFPIITLLVVGAIGWMVRRLVSVPWAVALGLVLGGAMGNLMDRLFRAPGPFVGHVVDMISVFDDSGDVWPVFNIADSCLVVGVVLAILLEATGRQRDGSRVRSIIGGRAGEAGADR